MALKRAYEVEPRVESVGQAVVGVAERAEERVSLIIQTMDSAAQMIQDTLRRTQNSASASMGVVRNTVFDSDAFSSTR
jgi:hypothetical protein